MNDILYERIELEKKIGRGLGKVDDYFRLGKLYLEGGQYAELLSLYEQLEEKALSRVELARLYYERGEALECSQRDEAIASYRKSLLHISPKDDSGESLFLKGLCHYNLFLLVEEKDEKLRHGEVAIKTFKDILHNDVAFRDKYALFSYIGDILIKLDQYEEALSFYNAALEKSLSPIERSGALTGLAIIFGHQKEINKAEKYFDAALKEASESVPTSKIYYERGKMFFLVNEFSKANDGFRLALDNIERDPILKMNQEYRIEILWHLGIIAYELKHDEEAIDHLLGVLGMVGEFHYYYANCNLSLGHIYLFRKDYIKAREHYNRVLTAPSSFDQEKRMAKRCLGQIPLDS